LLGQCSVPQSFPLIVSSELLLVKVDAIEEEIRDVVPYYFPDIFKYMFPN